MSKDISERYTHVLNIYKAYLEYNNLIDKYKESGLSLKKIRRSNFPELVSEPLANILLADTSLCNGGDLITNSKEK